jgi:hypothetical protein
LCKNDYETDEEARAQQRAPESLMNERMSDQLEEEKEMECNSMIDLRETSCEEGRRGCTWKFFWIVTNIK